MNSSPFKYWRFCAFAGPIFLITYVIFWGLMGSCILPLPATMPAAEMAQYFKDHAATMRTGMVCAMTFSPFYMIWGLGIARVMETLEGNNRMMSVMQIWGAGLTVMVVLVCCIFILGGLFRVDSLDPSLIQLMYDLSWLTIDVSYPVTSMQMIAMGIGFLADRRAQPLFPKWACWFSIWGGTMFMGENLMPFFHHGIFARNGLLNFWTEYTIYFVYMIIVTKYLLSAIKRLEQEHADGTLDLGPGIRYGVAKS